MKKCELCKAKARMHCVSDQASLCWVCDSRVHSANFLVARHLRNLLCHVCQSPTPWSACGGKLGAAVSLCEQCVDLGRDEVEEEVVLKENQVVPWSPPAESSSSIEDDVSARDVFVSRKRFRIENDSSNNQSKEDESCASSHKNTCTRPSDSAAGVTETLSKTKTPPHKSHITQSGRVEVCESRILDSLRRLHQKEAGSGEEMAESCNSLGPSI